MYFGTGKASLFLNPSKLISSKNSENEMISAVNAITVGVYP